LSEVKNINLWGCKLQDVSILKEMPNVEIVSLSVNSIDSLKYFACCSKLKELYLRKNNISELQEVESLCHLEHLRVLWLCDNPCVGDTQYRKYVIHKLRGLTKLDNSDITPEERDAADQELGGAPASPGSPVGKASPGSPVGKSSPTMEECVVGGSPRPRPASAGAPLVPVPMSPASANRQNVVTAITFLLDELDPTGLAAIRDAVDKRLGR